MHRSECDKNPGVPIQAVRLIRILDAASQITQNMKCIIHVVVDGLERVPNEEWRNFLNRILGITANPGSTKCGRSPTSRSNFGCTGKLGATYNFDTNDQIIGLD